MVRPIQFLWTFVTTPVRSRLSLQAENAALRNQLFLYRKSGQRPGIRPADRLLWCFMAKFWSGWRAALYSVQPRTVMIWQGKRFCDYWRALSQAAKPGQPRISPETRKLIGQIWEANPTWGAPKIVAELAMLARGLFDRVIVFNERHLKRLMSSYLDYYHLWRTHQSLDRDAPDGRPAGAAEPCNVVECPAVHGLHHVYLPKAV